MIKKVVFLNRKLKNHVLLRNLLSIFSNFQLFYALCFIEYEYLNSHYDHKKLL